MVSASLHEYLARFRRRLRFKDAWRQFQRTFPLAALAVLAIQVLGRVVPIERMDLWSVSPLAAWLLVVAAYSLLAPLSPMRVARRIDLDLELRERLSTALAFESITESADRALVGLQRRDALLAAAAIQPRRDIPLLWEPRPLLAALVLLVLAAASGLLPNPMDAVVAERRAVRAEATRQAERVEELKEEIASSDELSPEEKEELLRRLTELAEKLRLNRGDLEQAMADLSNLEKELSSRLDPNSAAKAANLEALAERLSSLANRPRDPQAGAAAAAADALDALADQLNDLDREEQQELAKELAQLAAQSSQAGDAALAQALSSLAQALQSGDTAAAQAAAQTAAGEAEITDQELTEQEALQSAIAALQAGRAQLAQASRAALAQAGQSVGQSGASGQSNQPGQSGQSGQGAQAGQQPGQSQGTGATTGGGGSQANTLPPSTGGASNVRPRGEGSDTPAGELAQQVYSPWERPAASSSQTLTLPGIDTGQGTTQTSQGQSNLPGAVNPALVPYDQVFQNYFTAANQALQTSHIPSALSSYVQSYFTTLAPR